MPVNYGTYGEFINPSILEALQSRRHPLGNNNAYPVIQFDPFAGNFEQQCAKKRFNDVIAKYQEASNTVGTPVIEFANYIGRNLMSHSIQGLKMSCEMEEVRRPKLEKLAIDIVCRDFNIKEGDVIFDVKLVGFGEVKFPPNITLDKEEMMEPPEISDTNFEYDVDDEVQKREFINALISGASKKGHYIFHLGKEELDAIDARLIPLYKLLMSANDLSYYLIGDLTIESSMDSSDDDSHAGFEKLSFTEEGIPIITVEAVNFPTLLHELIKGVIELIATLALPNDKPLTEYLYDMADYVKAEIWYLRLGPVYWERLLSCFPVEYSKLKSQLLGKMFELETDEFNALMKSAISVDNQEAAKKFFVDWGRIITENIRDYNQRNA